MAKFNMMIGLPGSGKSYAAKKVGGIVLSSDDIREELLGSAEDQRNATMIFSVMFERTIAALNSGMDVVYDATNITAKYRKALLKKLPEGTEKVAVFVTTPLETCLKRNAERSRHVPEDVILRMHDSLEAPTYCEGWNAILRV